MCLFKRIVKFFKDKKILPVKARAAMPSDSEAENRMYVIEGTISEVSVSNDGSVSFKITGSEGYAVKQKDKKFNVFCADIDADGKSGRSAYVLGQDIDFSFEDTGVKDLLMQSVASNKRVRIKFAESELATHLSKEKDKAKVHSVTLLSD